MRFANACFLCSSSCKRRESPASLAVPRKLGYRQTGILTGPWLLTSELLSRALREVTEAGETALSTECEARNGKGDRPGEALDLYLLCTIDEGGVLSIRAISSPISCNLLERSERALLNSRVSKVASRGVNICACPR